MTDKEKLIQLLQGAERKVKDKNPNMPLNEWLDIYADHLIAEGVIVPRPERGGVVYTIKFRVGNYHITQYHDRFEVVFSPYKPIGKTMTFKKFTNHPTEKGSEQSNGLY